MSRLIDADKLIERINGTGYAEQIKSNLRFMVDMQPTIDAVDLIRRKLRQRCCRTNTIRVIVTDYVRGKMNIERKEE